MSFVFVATGVAYWSVTLIKVIIEQNVGNEPMCNLWNYNILITSRTGFKKTKTGDIRTQL